MGTLNFAPLRNALLYHCTLYTDFPGGSTDFIARHVNIAQIICCRLRDRRSACVRAQRTEQRYGRGGKSGNTRVPSLW